MIQTEMIQKKSGKNQKSPCPVGAGEGYYVGKGTEKGEGGGFKKPLPLLV